MQTYPIIDNLIETKDSKVDEKMHIAWDYLDPIQKAQIAILRPDIYKVLQEELLK